MKSRNVRERKPRAFALLGRRGWDIDLQGWCEAAEAAWESEEGVVGGRAGTGVWRKVGLRL